MAALRAAVDIYLDVRFQDRKTQVLIQSYPEKVAQRAQRVAAEFQRK